MTESDEFNGVIAFDKYLNCPDCREYELYCPKHRIEVEKILAKRDLEPSHDSFSNKSVKSIKDLVLRMKKDEKESINQMLEHLENLINKLENDLSVILSYYKQIREHNDDSENKHG